MSVKKPAFCYDSSLVWVSDVKAWFESTSKEERGSDREEIAYKALFFLVREGYFGEHKTISRSVRFSKKDVDYAVDIEVKKVAREPIRLQVKPSESRKIAFEKEGLRRGVVVPCCVIVPEMTFQQVKDHLLEVLKQYRIE